MSTDELTPEALVERVETLSSQLQEIGDPFARSVAEDLVGAVMDLYGAGLERLLEVLDAAGPAGEEVRRAVVDDGVIASLLLIHGLYPVDLETRVAEALETVRPYMHSHGGNVEVLGFEEGVVRLRLEGSCSGCPGSTATLESAIRQALEEAAPDLAGVVVEGLDAPVRSPG